MSNSITRGIIVTAIAAAAAAPAVAQQTVELPGRDKALKEKPADVFTVGTVEGESWEMFSGVRSVAFDRADNVYLLDGQNHRVVVFDARGRFVREFGSQGGGPGEFQAPLGMDIAADGNIVVSDLGNRAFIVFTPAGEHVRNVPFDESIGFPMAIATDRTGSVIARANQALRPGQMNTAAAAFSPVLRHTLDDGGPAPQTLYRIPVTPPKVVQSGGSSSRRVMTRSMDPVFGPRPTFGVLPSGIALHHETAYSVRILDTDGRPVRTITRDHKPKKVAKKDQEEWKERRAEELENGTGGQTMIMAVSSAGAAPAVRIGGGGQGAPPAGAAAMLEDTPFAEFMSVVTRIRTDPLNRIWIQRRGSDDEAEGPIDLVMADGRYIGTLPPQPLPDAVSASGLAAWIVRDDLGVERVRVSRLPPSWR